ncbi:MAG: valine--tRNA ligase, partial [Gammaproteobacteria bacterium]|nr:valine--tRNA ligase [Gammaproteobacteria bacterium]
TMLGDTAVAVHPEDERYRELIGKRIKLPLTDRLIPVIADDYVDPEFGSGCVKITPAHDFNDYEIGQRHGLDMINILTIDAALNENTPEKYRGMDRFTARKQVAADLDTLGLLEKIEDHKLMVPRGDRSHEIVEPFLTDQWYVKVEPLAKQAIKVVEDGRIKFVPENWSKTYFEWMRNIQDWCISRQLWWGHRIPAWYDGDGNIYVGEDEDAVRKKYSLSKSIQLTQDEDVLDTWFSSALFPFSTLGWPEQTKELKTFYPTTVLVTAFDIIFFWVARMIMMGLKFMDDVPFREVYIHGLIRDQDGNKMSKSKGNTLDPLDLIDGIGLESLVKKRTSGLMQPHLASRIEKATRKQFPEGIRAYGTDALRFTFAALASTSRDINFDMGRVEGYRNFCNKIWNAARYVLMNTEDQDTGLKGNLEYSLADKWIRSRLHGVVKDVYKHIAVYRFDLAAKALYEFTWYEYCDWYLELSKPVLQSESATAEQKRGTRNTLVVILEALLRLLHPIMPYITEEIWQRVAKLAGKTGDTIMLQAYPESDDFDQDADAETEMQWVMDFILGIRRIRGEMDISPARALPVLLQDASEKDRGYLNTHAAFLTSLARTESITVLEDGEDAPQCAMALLGDMKILVPMAGLIDKDAELARLKKQLDKHAQDLTRVSAKLANRSFVDNAPEQVVNKEREREKDIRNTIAQLETQVEKIASL